MSTQALLQIAATLQLAIAVLNLFLVRLLEWKEDLARMPLLLREVFQVHAWFISITLAIFGVMTWRFAPDMASLANPVCRWLAAAIGAFWAIRTVLQVAYYSSSHWRGKPARTLAHLLLLVIYGGFACLYLWTAFGQAPEREARTPKAFGAALRGPDNRLAQSCPETPWGALYRTVARAPERAPD